MPNLTTAPLFGCFTVVKSNNKIKRLHERCLRLIYGDKKSSYKNLLEKDNSVSIHHKNIKALAVEMFKVKNKLCPEITGDILWKGQTISSIYVIALIL